MEPDNNSKGKKNSPEDAKFPGYPVYPESEDALSGSHKKKVLPLDGELNESEATGHASKRPVPKQDLDSDLDVPGSELDDAEEQVGEEDEENNYYSLGGDRHDDLEEDPDQ